MSGSQQHEPMATTIPGWTSIILAATVGILSGLTVGSIYRAEGALLLMFLILVVYVAITLLAPRNIEMRLLVALFMVCAHMGLVLAYYSNPIVLPFIVIERGDIGNSINIDFTQLILAYEMINAYISSGREKKQAPNIIEESLDSGLEKRGETN